MVLDYAGQSNQIQYRKSQKGKMQLTCNGFYYCREKILHEKEYWRCIYYTTKIKCHARIHTIGDQVQHYGKHNHLAKLFKRADYKRLSEIVIPQPLTTVMVMESLPTVQPSTDPLRTGGGIQVKSTMSLSAAGSKSKASRQNLLTDGSKKKCLKRE